MVFLGLALARHPRASCVARMHSGEGIRARKQDALVTREDSTHIGQRLDEEGSIDKWKEEKEGRID